CGRHTAVLKDQRVLLTLTNGPEKPFVRVLPRHKKYEGAGKKATTFINKIWLEYADASVISMGQEATLMDWGNAIIKEIKTENGTISELLGELHLESWKKMMISLTILIHALDEKLQLSENQTCGISHKEKLYSLKGKVMSVDRTIAPTSPHDPVSESH
ncbi:hypothetical protein ABZP36_014847, partial [Zizania latifolia]